MICGTDIAKGLSHKSDRPKIGGYANCIFIVGLVSLSHQI